jgi:hypothetical protein
MFRISHFMHELARAEATGRLSGTARRAAKAARCARTPARWSSGT